MSNEIKYCKKCNTAYTIGEKFCGNCGERLDSYDGTIGVFENLTPENDSPNEIKTGRKNIKPIVLISSVIVLTVITALLVLFGSNFFNKETGNSDNSLIQANTTCWGYAVFNDNDTYYSDGKSSIYKMNHFGNKDVLISGNYSDLGLLGETIFCVEYIDADTGYSIVGIDVNTGEKKNIYKPKTSESQLISINVVDGKYYFTEDQDALYSVDLDGKVENTGFRYVKKLTESGIYTTETSKYGLKLLSHEGEEITKYPDLDDYEVSILFEKDGKLYLNLSKDGVGRVYEMNVKSGKMKLFPNDEDFFENNVLSYVNYYEDTYFISKSEMLENGEVEYKVFTMDSDGNNIEMIHSEKSDSALPFCTINVTQDFIMIHYPITMMEPEIIETNTIKTK